MISPCRDEAQLLMRTAESVLGQSELPARWVIVDDGSQDETPQLLSALAAERPFIEIVTRQDRGERKLGSGVVHAFNAGLETVSLDDYDYVCKLDLDLVLPADYFATMMDLCEEDPRLASVSGKPYYHGAEGQRVWEPCGDENCVGMAKFYRVLAFQQVGGFVPELMWDGIDCHTSRMLGWRSRAVGTEAVAFEHLRAMGSSDRSILRGRRRHGRGQWFMGSSLPYVLASAVLRLRVQPYVSGSLHMMAGYAAAAASRMPRHDDVQFRRQVRRFQRESLLLGKGRAIARWESRTAEEWRRRNPSEAAGMGS
nr:glycosyltransferase [Motilibacter deserti]